MLGVVTNVFEAVDVITLIKGGTYDGLNLNVGEALQRRPEVSDLTTYEVSYIDQSGRISLGYILARLMTV